MSKFFLVFFMFICIQTYSQTNQNYTLKSNVNLHIYPSENRSFYNGDEYKTRNSDVSFEVGFSKTLSPKLYYGVDINYQYSMYKLRPVGKITKRIYVSTGGYYFFPDYRIQKNMINAYCPLLYLGYRLNITDRIDISFEIYNRLDFKFYKEKCIDYYADFNMIFNDSPYVDYLKSVDVSKSNMQYINFGIKPVLRFRLFSRSGIYLSLGMAEFNALLHESNAKDSFLTEHHALIGIKPSYWMIGIWKNI
jgi:hypothetical protein